MTYPIFATMDSEIRQELDLQDEGDSALVTAAEMKTYFNQGVDVAESEIHTLYEDYFLKRTTLSMVSGETDISLPSDIYASKLRSLVYSNGSDIYELKRISYRNKFVDIEWLRRNGAQYLRYCYTLFNDSATNGIKIMLLPASRETSSNLIAWYLRTATRYESASSRCDIPQFSEFLKQFVRVKCLDKDKDTDMLGVAKADLAALKMQMVETLQGMVVDSQSEIDQDASHYEEST